QSESHHVTADTESEDLAEIECEGREYWPARKNSWMRDGFRDLRGLVYESLTIDRVQQPPKAAAVLDVLLHLGLKIGQSIRRRTKLDDKVRADFTEPVLLFLAQPSPPRLQNPGRVR